MLRLMIPVLVSLLVWSTGAAAALPRSVPARRVEAPGAAPPVAVKKSARLGNSSGKFRVTTQTEIWLDGRQCQFQNVPDDAFITFMELAADRETVLRVTFRSRR